MCAQSARSAPAKERCRTHPPVDSSCAPRERGEERTRCGEQRLKRACGARTSSCASVARPSLPAARRSQRSCPACSLFTCRAATCQRTPCAEQLTVGGAPTPGCLRALHSTGRSWRPPVHARRAGQPPGEAVGRERRYAKGCEFPSLGIYFAKGAHALGSAAAAGRRRRRVMTWLPSAAPLPRPLRVSRVAARAGRAPSCLPHRR